MSGPLRKIRDAGKGIWEKRRDTIAIPKNGVMPPFFPRPGSSGVRGGFARLGRYMLMEMLRPPLPKRGLTTLLRVEPKEKFRPIEKE